MVHRPSRHAGRWAVALSLAIAVAVLALHVEYARHAGALWRDEVNGVNVAMRPTLGEALADSHYDSFPPVWVALMHAWRSLGETDATWRRLGFVLGLATVPTIWWAAWRLGSASPPVALLLFAANPTVVIFGGSVRGYGLASLVIAASMACFWAFARRPSAGTFAAALVATVLAVETYLPNGVYLAAVGAGAAVVCLTHRATRALAGLAALGAAAGAALLMNLPWLRYGFEVAPLERSGFGLAAVLDVLGVALTGGVPALGVVWAVAAAGAALGCAMTLRRRDDAAAEDVDLARFALVAAAAGVGGYVVYLLWVARIRPQYWYGLSLMAVLALSCEVGTRLLARRWRYGELGRAVAAAVAAGLVAREVVPAVRVRMTDIDVVADAVAREATRDDLVVVVPWYCGITFARYYRGAAPWITLPELPDHAYHVHLLVKEKMRAGDAGIRPELDRIAGTLRAGGRVWIVGTPIVPPPGTSPSLPPAPSGPEGWHVGPYLEGWKLQLGAALRSHAGTVSRIGTADVGLVNAAENEPLFVAEGWK